MSAPSAGLHDEALRALLLEDAPHGDLTTRGLALGDEAATIRFEARGAMTVAGIEAAARMLQLCGVAVVRPVSSGEAVAAGAVLLDGQGPAAGVLLGWKSAQTLVEACSGIAGATAAIVRRLREAGFATPLACTRKSFPGTRWLAAEAVQAGGGVMHRLGLSETLLVFPEHRALLPPGMLAARLQALRQAQPEKRLVVETGDEEEALALARLGVDVLQLERFDPARLAALKARLHAEGLGSRLAPAGGVTLDNALAFAAAGADLLVSSAPYFAPPADVRVRIGPAAVADVTAAAGRCG
ncbi:ModD protein [Sphaerotilus uruguayifluvii]|uniref:Putative pyrophosphorylase ModD n=1 Tax=Sphaerotilus uruguayifluvii TaxID=2735897 RepID=A0ABX2G8R7_9BURK|nr:ModD protein [Leptothrix sp. C29]NRT58450.1 molybdenum transport protein [Leptothrix sp. C29]